MIVPTYHRAHLLERTIPSYLQPEVNRLILVDDCSPDDTAQVAAALMRQDSRIQYLRNDVNRKQTHSKNRGLELADTEFVYFGDDDSLLSEGAMACLLETLHTTQADLVGAAALYLLNGESDAELQARRRWSDQADEISYLPGLRFDVSVRAPSGLEIPICQAAFLARLDTVRALRFDTGYIGNCFREETDFLVACRAKGARIVLETRATQTNLPPSVATGGARGRSRLRYEWYSLYNTVRFLKKNHRALRAIDARCHPPIMLAAYVGSRFSGLARKVRNRLTGT